MRSFGCQYLGSYQVQNCCGLWRIVEFFVSGDQVELVDIPVCYTRDIQNLDDTDMVIVM
ncbi:MAG: hypothetical protein WCR58_10535 [Bacteroidales bacterium]|jgi:hypothetical protein|nr:hypothetical protein [Bacteroidales bacterium]MDY0370581.1 hypothetical protein [Bacteroidales bacterium]